MKEGILKLKLKQGRRGGSISRLIESIRFEVFLALFKIHQSNLMEQQSLYLWFEALIFQIWVLIKVTTLCLNFESKPFVTIDSHCTLKKRDLEGATLDFFHVFPTLIFFQFWNLKKVRFHTCKPEKKIWIDSTLYFFKFQETTLDLSN